MNKTDAVLLCRYVKAMCPAQQIDEYTPDAWSDVLDDISLEDAKLAIQNGVKWGGWRFIDVAEVIAAVQGVRGERISNYRRQFGPLIPPAELDDDFNAYQGWMIEATNRIRSGEVTHPSQLDQEPVAELLPRDVDSLGLIGHTVPPTPGGTK